MFCTQLTPAVPSAKHIGTPYCLCRTRITCSASSVLTHTVLGFAALSRLRPSTSWISLSRYRITFTTGSSDARSPDRTGTSHTILPMQLSLVLGLNHTRLSSRCLQKLGLWILHGAHVARGIEDCLTVSSARFEGCSAQHC
jgi:hypothetical protein